MNLLVFDSGIGGLGVVTEIRRLQPHANITYLADNDFYPYGEKPDQVLISRILRVIRAAIERIAPDAVVIACNTASTVALSHLRKTFQTPFIGCVPPIKPAAAATRSGHIGLLATPATIRRAYLADLAQKFAAGCTLHSHGTTLLAEFAEAMFRGQPLAPADLEAAIAPLLDRPGGEQIDTVALGCTHYSFLLPALQRLRPDIKWFDPAAAVARQTAAVTNNLASTTLPPFPNTAFSTSPRTVPAALRSRLRDYGFDQYLHFAIDKAQVPARMV